MKKVSVENGGVSWEDKLYLAGHSDPPLSLDIYCPADSAVLTDNCHQ